MYVPQKGCKITRCVYKASDRVGAWRLRRILPSPHGFELVMDDPIGRVPDAPDPHVAVTVWTAQGVAPDAALVALAVGQRCNDLERALDDVLHLCQGLVKHVLDGGKRLGGLRAVIPDPLKTLWKQSA